MKVDMLRRLSAAGVAFSLLTSCAISAAQAAPSRETVTVTFWTAYTRALGTTFQTLVDQFQATHPNVKVQDIVSTDYTSLLQKEQSAVFASGLPTGGQAYESWTAQFAASHAVLDLGPYIRGKDGLSRKQLDDYFPKVWADGLLGKTRYMVPFSKSDEVLYYNPALLKKYGISKPPATWTEFAADAKKVTVMDNGHTTQWGSTFEVTEPLWYTWEKEWGATILNKNRKAVFASKQGIAPMTFFASMARNHTAIFSTATNYPGQADFDAGKTAFYVGTSAGLTYVVSGAKPGVQVKVAMIPAGPKGRATELFGANMVLFNTGSSAQKTAGWQFLKFITQPGQTAYWSIHTGYMPVRQSALKLKIMQDYLKANPGERAPVEQLKYAFVEPAFPQWIKAESDIAAEVGAALTLSKSPQEAMQAAQDQVNADLSGGS